MKELPLYRNKKIVAYSLVDDEDYERAAYYRWTFHKGYAQRVGMGKTTMLHRFIIQAKRGEITDHINGDKLDNRKSNLRTCTSSQNSMNRRLSIVNKSGYKGVCWRYNTNGKHWCATIYKNGKQFHLGYFWTPEEAARKYNELALRLFGEFALVNVLPEED